MNDVWARHAAELRAQLHDRLTQVDVAGEAAARFRGHPIGEQMAAVHRQVDAEVGRLLRALEPSREA